MNPRRRFTLATAMLLAVVCLTATRPCQAQYDPGQVFLDRGNYSGAGYGTAYNPRYSSSMAYGQWPYNYGSNARYSSPTYSYPASSAGPVGYDTGVDFSNPMGPRFNSFNGLFGATSGIKLPFRTMYGPYIQHFYGPNGPVAYHGPYGFRGFDR